MIRPTSDIEPPEGIIITISQAMLKEKGVANWTRNFLRAMRSENCAYFMKLGSRPKYEVLYVYLCIAGKVRYRANFVESHGPGEFTFQGGKTLYGNAWVVLAGPLSIPHKPIVMKGFRGFRYTHKLF